MLPRRDRAPRKTFGHDDLRAADPEARATARAGHAQEGVWREGVVQTAPFRRADPSVEILWHNRYGDAVARRQHAVLRSRATSAPCTAERTAINFVQLLRGWQPRPRDVRAVIRWQARAPAYTTRRKTIPVRVIEHEGRKKSTLGHCGARRRNHRRGHPDGIP